MKRLILALTILLIGTILSAQILIYGDTRNHPEVHRELISKVQDTSYELILFTGDMNRKGTLQSEYDEFKEIIAPLKGRFLPARGNHEDDLQLFKDNFPFPGGHSYQAIVHDSLHYFILDSTSDIMPASRQYQWLKKTMEASTLPKIVVIHHPPFSSGAHGDADGLALFLPALFKKHNVKLVFSAHDHDFEHLNYDGIDYVVSGGGGAPLREMSKLSPHSRYFKVTHHYVIMNRAGRQLQISAYDLSGNLLHTFQTDI